MREHDAPPAPKLLMQQVMPGVLVESSMDRVARTLADLEEFLDALQDAGGQLMIDGRVYDPSDAADVRILRRSLNAFTEA